MQATPATGPVPRPSAAAPPPDGLLARCAASRCSESWSQLLDLYGHKLSAGVGRALARSGAHHGPDPSEDLVQEVLCRLLADDARILTRCRGRNEREIGAYLFRVAESVAVDQLRMLVAAKRGGPIDGESAAARVDPACCEVHCGRPGPERQLMLQQERRRFLALCRGLIGPSRGPRDLQIVYLALFEGCSSREIARRSRGRVTASAVDSLIHRLRRRLAARGLGLPQRTRRHPGVS
jgi:RNA polymerase sigma factor (sigma-70 family)